VAAFGIGALAELNGPEVTLFPVDGVTFYRLPQADRGRLGVSLRTEFSNTAGADQPDALVEQWVSVSVDGAAFACFGQRGDARVLVSDGGASTSRRSELCDENRCYQLGPHGTMLLGETPVRRTIRPGEIFSAEQYFDTRAVTATHPCGGAVRAGERPTAADFIGAGEAARRVVIDYHARMLKDGGFTAHCELTASPQQLRKFDEDGWAGFSCDSVSVRRTASLAQRAQ
jgi:hypothetical protein